MDDRRLTLIVVPHGDLETRTFEVSYRKLKLTIILGFVLLLLGGFLVASWFPVAAQAGRVPGLERDLERLEGERARVAELAQALAEVEAQYERVRQLLGAEGGGQNGAPVLPPLRSDTAREMSPELETSGMLSDWPLAVPGFITRAQFDGRTRHPGLDIATPANSYIRAAGAGVVLEAGFDSVYGIFVRLDHGDGLESLYGHASRVFVRPGDRVRRREVIALTGSTGRSTAPHLHFEVRRDGQPVDPLTYVRQP